LFVLLNMMMEKILKIEPFHTLHARPSSQSRNEQNLYNAVMLTAKSRPTQRAPDPRKITGAGVVGIAAFSGSLCGLKLVPSKWRCLVPPTSPHQGANATGNASR
jgi:hypothetical protein